jgi:isopenicillin-N epimerase
MAAATSIATAAELAALADLYLLDKDVTFLNHGSFGACPRPVFETYQQWQRELERQPVAFLSGRARGLLAEARQHLGEFIGTDGGNLAFVTNTTVGVNAIARSLALKPGDEVLSTNHEYGAIDRTWRYYCERQGARHVSQPIDLPITTTDAFVEQLWAGVTEHTRVIAISHITSATALIFPVAEVCRRARAAGILTVIDGAHAPGQIDLCLDDLGADFYVGNCHKWLSAPKGSAFLFARPERQELLEPFVISWGYQSDRPGPSRFVDHYSTIGTDDPSGYLSVPAAIDFQREHDWPRVRAACHALVRQAHDQLHELTGLPPIAPEDWWAQMSVIPLPSYDPAEAHARLWDEYRIVIPLTRWQDRQFVRLSIQAYNNQQDIERLVEALTPLIQRT